MKRCKSINEGTVTGLGRDVYRAGAKPASEFNQTKTIIPLCSLTGSYFIVAGVFRGSLPSPGWQRVLVCLLRLAPTGRGEEGRTGSAFPTLTSACCVGGAMASQVVKEGLLPVVLAEF